MTTSTSTDVIFARDKHDDNVTQHFLLRKNEGDKYQCFTDPEEGFKS